MLVGSTAKSTNFGAFFVTCYFRSVEAFPGTTHTRLTISTEIMTCHRDAGSTTEFSATLPPLFLHITSNPAANSWGAVWEFPAGSESTIRTSIPECEITIRPQSIRAMITDNLKTIEIRDRTVVFTLNRGSPAFCPDHRVNNRIEVATPAPIAYSVDTMRTRITNTSPVGG
jgi:hypothetical protein